MPGPNSEPFGNRPHPELIDVVSQGTAISVQFPELSTAVQGVLELGKDDRDKEVILDTLWRDALDEDMSFRLESLETQGVVQVATETPVPEKHVHVEDEFERAARAATRIVSYSVAVVAVCGTVQSSYTFNYPLLSFAWMGLGAGAWKFARWLKKPI